jgi:hypothetical protein
MELYTEGDLVTRTVRDVFSNDIDRIVIDNKEVAKRVKEVIKLSNPRTKNKVEFYEGLVPIFHEYGIEREIEQMYTRHVPLPSGGSLVIDSTEAIVAIDVNSGKFRDHADAETTAFKTDMEAADEISRQLKLRDLGGVIICDFIDLRYERHRRELEKRLHDNLKRDRAKTKVLRMSQFGIIEMTRQRMRPSLKRSVYFDCPHCKGTGLVKTPESMSLDVMRKLAIAIADQRVERVELIVCPEVAFFLLNRKRGLLSELEERHHARVIVRQDQRLGLDEIQLELFDSREGLVYLEELGMTPFGQQQGEDPRRRHPHGGHARGGPQGTAPSAAAFACRRRAWWPAGTIPIGARPTSWQRRPPAAAPAAAARDGTIGIASANETASARKTAMISIASRESSIVPTMKTPATRPSTPANLMPMSTAPSRRMLSHPSRHRRTTGVHRRDLNRVPHLVRRRSKMTTTMRDRTSRTTRMSSRSTNPTSPWVKGRARSMSLDATEIVAEIATIATEIEMEFATAMATETAAVGVGVGAVGAAGDEARANSNRSTPQPQAALAALPDHPADATSQTWMSRSAIATESRPNDQAASPASPSSNRTAAARSKPRASKPRSITMPKAAPTRAQPKIPPMPQPPSRVASKAADVAVAADVADADIGAIVMAPPSKPDPPAKVNRQHMLTSP